MRINNNLMAMNSHRQLGIGTNQGAKSMEKLSSGFRINRAGDDAAGLAISEKMRGQIRGLNQASRNAQDGISLIQTAEGALNETHAILQRMRELAVQSSTDTNTGVDRNEIQKEIDELAKEITRIADTTEFNTKNLLGGKFDATFHIGANEGQNVGLKISEMTSDALSVKGELFAGDKDVVAGLKIASRSAAGTVNIELIAAGTGSAAVEKTEAKYDADTKTIKIELKQDAAASTVTVGTITATHADIKAALESVAEEAGIIVSIDEDFAAASTAAAGTSAIALAKDENADVGINVSNQKAASSAITTINSAIENVSAERSKLGAMQNRLEHTIKNLDTSAENLQASEARIRDVDMAKEMMEFTKNNILQQAAQAMLAQANAAPQGVLQLLR